MTAQIISFNCVLKNKIGQLISSTFNHEVLNSLETGQTLILSGLAKGLQNVKKGERRSITLSAEDAYGLYDPKKVILYPRNKLPTPLKKGEPINIVSKSGVLRSYRVVELFPNLVSLDGNHPLAGQDLIFEIETLAARDATSKEIEESLNVISKQLLN